MAKDWKPELTSFDPSDGTIIPLSVVFNEDGDCRTVSDHVDLMGDDDLSARLGNALLAAVKKSDPVAAAKIEELLRKDEGHAR
ncbi:hypothetical protein CP98_03917 [Sphingobium yanoikuyae]|uniref:Uncharacterized protein n=1 Tax=Sphingobium yanoikuyae TaxID=13690 RepID=A0A084EFF0_SPHYA|nr:hypothetical protein [Sphingobium yanoikuyae]KEZ16692.1 hypothetical protein CP98_03917 [Sphingobium yanoikuyae]